MKRPLGTEKQNGIFPVIQAINVNVTALLSPVLSLFSDTAFRQSALLPSSPVRKECPQT